MVRRVNINWLHFEALRNVACVRIFKEQPTEQ